MIDCTQSNINPFDFARTHRQLLVNLAEHGSPIEKVMAKAYLELYGGANHER